MLLTRYLSKYRFHCKNVIASFQRAKLTVVCCWLALLCIVSLSLLFLCVPREHASSRRRARSFPPVCPWVSLCVYAEGKHQETEMPSKIIFDTEDQAMDEDASTVVEAKTLKVSGLGLCCPGHTVSSAELVRRRGSASPCLTTCGLAC